MITSTRRDITYRNRELEYDKSSISYNARHFRSVILGVALVWTRRRKRRLACFAGFQPLSVVHLTEQAQRCCSHTLHGKSELLQDLIARSTRAVMIDRYNR